MKIQIDYSGYIFLLHQGLRENSSISAHGTCRCQPKAGPMQVASFCWQFWRGHLSSPHRAAGHSRSHGEPEGLLWFNTPHTWAFDSALFTAHPLSPHPSPLHTQPGGTEKNTTAFHRHIFGGETISSRLHAANSVTNICSKCMRSTWQSSVICDFRCTWNTKTIAQLCILLKDKWSSLILARTKPLRVQWKTNWLRWLTGFGVSTVALVWILIYLKPIS